MSIFVWIYCLQVPASKKNNVERINSFILYFHLHMEMLALKGYILNLTNEICIKVFGIKETCSLYQ